MTAEFLYKLGTDAILALVLLMLFHYISKLSSGVRGILAWGIGHFIYSIGAILIDAGETLTTSFHLQNYLLYSYIVGTLLANIGLATLTYSVISFANGRKARRKEHLVFALMLFATPLIWLKGINYDTSGAIMSINEIIFLLFVVIHFKRFKQPPFKLPAQVIICASFPLFYLYVEDFLTSLNQGYAPDLERVNFDLAIWFLFNFCMLMITSFKAAENFRNQAMTDALTGALNRRGFREKINSLGLEQNNEQSLAVLTFDLDHFKSFNDTYGHTTGDEVLITISTTVKSLLIQNELFVRSGGEEFIILIRNNSLDEIKALAEKLRLKVAGLNQENARIPRQITLSAGVSFTEEPMSISALIHQADQALYRAKSSGRNRIVYANDSSYLEQPIEFILG